MTLTKQVKILDNKIKANKAKYELDRDTAKISALSSGELEKYQYLTGEDLGYKPDIIQKTKFEYSPLGEAFNKAFKKDAKNKKVIKYDNNLAYSSVHNFNRYSLPNFNEISSINCKFDTINKFYKDLLKLNSIKSQSDNTKQQKAHMLKMQHGFTISGLICMRKNMSRFLKAKVKIGKKRYDYENFKEFKNYVSKIKDEETDKETDEETDKEADITWIYRPKNDFNDLLNKVSRY